MFERKKLHCPECTEEFVSNKEVTEHFENNHGKIAGDCPVCNESFVYKNNLKNHILLSEKVSVRSQILIFLLGIIIPFAWLYTFYKIKKIGYSILISILMIIPPLIGMLIAIELELGDTIGTGMVFVFFLFYVGRFPVELYLLIRWSRKWNAKLDSKINEI